MILIYIRYLNLENDQFFIVHSDNQILCHLQLYYNKRV